MTNVVDDFPTAHMVVQPGFTPHDIGSGAWLPPADRWSSYTFIRYKTLKVSKITLGQ